MENIIDSLNYLFITAEYIEEKYMGIQHDDNHHNQIVVTAAKKKPGIATKTNPSLWSRCKSEAKSRMGGKHSARAMQLALKLYKQRGGRFKGPKPTAKTNKMKKWTKQKWMYLSDFKKKKKDKNNAEGRYLPQAKWESLSPKERTATDQKKKREGKNKQYVPNTEAAKVKSKAKYYSKASVANIINKYSWSPEAGVMKLPEKYDSTNKNLYSATLEEKFDSITKACEFLGGIPTPIGNPFSYVAAEQALEKGNKLDFIVYLLTALPALGELRLAFSATSNIGKILEEIMLFGIKSFIAKDKTNKLKYWALKTFVNYFQSKTFIETINTALKSAAVTALLTNPSLLLKIAKLFGLVPQNTTEVKDTAELAAKVKSHLANEIAQLITTNKDLSNIIASFNKIEKMG